MRPPHHLVPPNNHPNSLAAYRYLPTPTLQGLAEVLAVLGPSHLDELLPDVLASCAARTRPAQREGALTLFQYLPLTMADALQVGSV